MRPESPSDFLERLDDDFAWRQKELTTIWADVKSAKEKSRSARIRAAVALLYAHWEGFVKTTADAYVEYVAGKRLSLSDLTSGFLALALRKRLREFHETNDISAHVDFVEFLRKGLTSRARLPKLGVIRTGANLNSVRLKRIVLTLGLNYSPFELKENLIDSQLLNWRNTIAHGKFLHPGEGDFETLYHEVSGLLRNFKDQVANAVHLKSYAAEHRPER